MIKTLKNIKEEGIKENTIYNCDCLEAMRYMKDKSVDLVLTDPDYNAKDIGPKHKVYSKGRMQLPPEKYKEFCKAWFDEATRISKRIVFTPGITNTHNYPQPDWQICWHKPAAVSYNRFGGFNAWEPVFIYGKMPKGKRLGQDYIKINTLNSKKGIESNHPCPKVIDLWLWLIDKFSNEGDLVADFLAGSGTTAIGCIKTNRNYICGDHNPKYCADMEKRIWYERQQLKLELI